MNFFFDFFMSKQLRGFNGKTITVKGVALFYNKKLQRRQDVVLVLKISRNENVC